MKTKTILLSLTLVACLSVWFFYFTGRGKSLKSRARLELIGMGLAETKHTPKSDLDAFDFSGALKDTQGNIVDLRGFAGKTLFVNIWASWCGPCRVEMPYIQQLYDKVKDHPDIEFLMVATDEDFSKSLQFVQTKEFTFPVYHAFEGLNTSMFTKTIPVTIVVNPEGKVVYYLNGTNNFDSEQFRNFLLESAKKTQ